MADLRIGDFMRPLVPKEVAELRKEVHDLMWADYGRAVHAHLLAEGGIEQVITRLALRPGQTTKTIADALRVYLTTGTRP